MIKGTLRPFYFAFYATTKYEPVISERILDLITEFFLKQDHNSMFCEERTKKKFSKEWITAKSLTLPAFFSFFEKN